MFMAAAVVFAYSAAGSFAAEGENTGDVKSGKITVISAGNEQDYTSMEEAINSVPKDNSNVTIKLNGNYVGNGIKVTGNQNITIDLNGNTWDITGLVGSTGTETNGLQLLKGATVTIKNGTLKSDKARLLIQNYCNLTLDGVTLSKGYVAVGDIVVSNNNGSTTITGGTVIDADDNVIAFDSDKWGNYDGGDVTLINGTINGDVQATNGGKMELSGGTINGNVIAKNYIYSGFEQQSGTIIISGTAVNGDVLAESKGLISVSDGNIKGVISSTGDNKVEITGGEFGTLGNGVNISADVAVEFTSNGETKTVVGKDNVEKIIANLTDGDEIVFIKEPEGMELEEIPDGVTVGNKSNNVISVNGDNLANGEEITVESEVSETPGGDNQQGGNGTDSDKNNQNAKTTGTDKNEATPETGDNPAILGCIILMLTSVALGGTLIAGRRRG